jgi:hypothetical protein
MYFTINGRFQVTIRRDDTTWSVEQATADSLPALTTVDHFARLDANSIGCYLDTLLAELDENDPSGRH